MKKTATTARAVFFIFSSTLFSRRRWGNLG
jgi:hypothetical protein